MSLVKIAVNDYYLRNRDVIRRRNQQYRLAHKEQIKKRQRRRKRLIRSGAAVPMKRVRVGNSYIFVGTASPNTPITEESPVEMETVRRI